MKKLNVHIVFSLITLGLLMLGLNMIPLFDWDELNFAESASGDERDEKLFVRPNGL